MPEGSWLVVAIVAIVVAWAIGEIVSNMKKSERQWRDVDKSKLRDWDDEDDWND